MARNPSVAVVILNYNYGRFLEEAIESARGQDYDNLETIVIDDGSTDHSREILANYSTAIIPVLKENGGQASAVNAGFAVSCSEVVIFLDADDTLLPGIVRQVAGVFQRQPEVAAVNYRLRVTDAKGHASDEVIPPRYLSLPEGALHRDVSRVAACASWVPTSGNAFASWALQRALPMPEPPFRTCADFYLVRATALLGPMYALEQVGGCYRVHGRNSYFGTALDLDQMRRRITMTRTAYEHLASFAEGLGLDDDLERAALFRDEIYLAQRLISAKLDPARHPVPDDSTMWNALLGAGAALRRGDLAVATRILRVLWFAGMLVLPNAYAARWAQQFFLQQRRSLNRILELMQRFRPGQFRARPGTGLEDSLKEGHPQPRESTAVVIINHNTGDLLQRCLDSVVLENPGELIVVDNASSDGSADLVREKYPAVRLIENPENAGYGAAANQAIQGCNSEYLLVLNSDTCLHPGALADLGAFLDRHPTTAAVGPRLTNRDGTLQRSCFPFPSLIHLIVEESGLGRLLTFIPLIRERYLRTWSHSTSRAVPWVSGAALVLRHSAFLSVGGFDESFHMYFEEVDLCYRMRSAGWQIGFTPAATVVHEGGASTRLQRVKMYGQLFTGMRRFYEKHYSGLRSVSLKGIVTLLMLMKILRDSAMLRFTRGSRRRASRADNLRLWHAVLAVYYGRRGCSPQPDAIPGGAA